MKEVKVFWIWIGLLLLLPQMDCLDSNNTTNSSSNGFNISSNGTNNFNNETYNPINNLNPPLISLRLQNILNLHNSLMLFRGHLLITLIVHKVILPYFCSQEILRTIKI